MKDNLKILKGLDNSGVSVVIITLNGRNRIKPTLDHLAAQRGIDFDWEILIVDNNSTDGTGKLAIELWNKTSQPCPLRVIEEPKPGQTYARKAGFINSYYRYTLFVDDDNWLSPGYVKFAYDKISADQQIAAIGGRGEFVFDKDMEVPEWFFQNAKNYGTGPQGKEDGDTTNYKKCLYTAGSIFDRVWISKLYAIEFNSVLSGRDGKSLMGGEDTELTYMLRLMGGRLHYYSAMSFKHYMPASRINWNYMLRLNKAIGKGNFMLHPYKINKENRSILFEFMLTSGLIVRYFLKSLFKGFKKGDSDQIILNRFIGKLEAFRYFKENKETIKKNKKAIANLKSKVK